MEERAGGGGPPQIPPLPLVADE
ncbi:mitochondrial-processing peptidase subunit beta [Cryptococcus neoformans c8]|nr:mitochondrial-processing peptidase subunit beta [Cryptococcus neoformans var. grubii c8]